MNRQNNNETFRGENMRVYEFAKELGKDSGDLVDELKSVFKFDIKSHLSGITEEQMQKVKDFYDKKNSTDMNQDLESRLKELDQEDDMQGREDEGETHHKEAMKDTFNIDDNIKINIDSAGKAREQYAKTVKKNAENPENWSDIKLKTKNQEVIVEKPSWFSRIFSWWSSN
tara:strand:- start:5866 stop:6378 length:513 start_codon:yes stop_codon:yes gene_type:complete